VKQNSTPSDGSISGPLEQFEQRMNQAADPNAVLEEFQRQYPDLAETFGKLADAMAMLQPTSLPDGASAWTQASQAKTRPPDRFGPYKVIRSIGRGGMGDVYEAVEEPLGRRVAVKTLQRHATNPSLLLRFDRERRTLARLHHTNVVPIYATGSEGDLLYFAMPYLSGASLGQVIKTARSQELSNKRLTGSSFEDLVQEAHSRSQSASNTPGATEPAGDPPAPDNASLRRHLAKDYIRTAVQVMATVAEGLHHAHEAGIVHRDIKPGNIIVELDGHAWLLDFGLASLRANTTAGPLAFPIESLASEADASMTVGMLGTPGYIPAEQQVDARRADDRSDVWALGVTLYELLTLRRAFRDNQAIREVEPTAPRRLSPSVDRGLEAILLKALCKDPAGRYSSAQAFANDLNHWLNGEPVSVWPSHALARPPWRAWLWSKRNKGWAAAIVLGAWAIAGGLAGGAAYFHMQAKAKERQLKLLEVQRREQGEHGQGWWHEAWRQLSGIAWTPDERGTVQGLAVGALGGIDITPEKELPIYAQSLAFAPDGQLWLGHTGSGSKRWNPETDGQESWPLEVSGPLAICPDGNIWQIGPTYTEPDNPERSPHDPRPKPRFPLHLLDIKQQTVVRSLSEPASGGMRLLTWTLSSQGSHAAASVLDAQGKQQILLWNAESGVLLRRIDCETSPDSPALPGPGLAFAPDVSVVATWDGSGRVDLWSVAEGQNVAYFRTQNALQCVAFGVNHWLREPPRGPVERWMIAAGGTDGLITLWNPATRGTWQMLRGAGDETRALAFGPDGTLLASAGRPGDVFLWDVATGRRLIASVRNDYTTALAFNSDGTRLAASSWYPFEREPSRRARTRLFALDSGRGIRHLRGMPASIQKVAFSRDGKRVAALSKDWWAGVWDRDTGRLILLCAVPRGLFHGNADLVFSPDARSLAVAAGKSATLWDVESGQSRHWDIPWGLTDALAYPDPGHLMLMRSEVSDGSQPPASGAPPATYPRVCVLRNLLGERPTERLKTITEFNWYVQDIVSSPDGAHFVVHGSSGTGPQNLYQRTRAYRVEGAFVATLPASEEFWSCAFDPSGRFLRCSTGPGFALLEPPTFRLLDAAPIRSPVALAQDARLWLVQPGNDGRVSVCDRAGKVLLHRLWERFSSLNPAFSPDLDGRYVLWGDDSGTVFVADLVEIQRRLTGLGLGW
jgi:serine/threonine protein kinase/WD40 repeat protein